MASTPTAAPRRPEQLVETERKFAVPADFAMPPLSGPDAGHPLVAGAPQRHDLTTRYYDCGDLRLLRAGITLRRRTGDVDTGWHLKVPAGARGRRTEVRLPLHGTADDAPPAELVALVSAYTLGEPLLPVAELRTTRTAVGLHPPGAPGRQVLEVVDDEVAVRRLLPGDGAERRFREIEVEHVATVGTDEPAPLASPDEAAGAVARVLGSAGAGPAPADNKLAVALGLGDGPAAGSPSPLDVPAARPGDPAAVLLQMVLRRYADALRRADLDVRLGADDAVHKLRVAARRLRSAMKTFRPLVDGAVADRLRAELGAAAGELGDARDREVLLEHLTGHVAALPAAVDRRRLRTFLQRRLEGPGRVDPVAVLSTPQWQRTLADVVAVAAAPPTTSLARRPASEVVPPLVAKAWRRMRRRVEPLRADGPAEEWHAARIAAKQLRYAAEAVAPVFGAPARDLAAQAERITETLGRHQDAHVAQDALLAMGATAAGDRVPTGTAFGLGMLHGVESDVGTRLRAQFLTEVWPEARRKRHRRWLRVRP